MSDPTLVYESTVGLSSRIANGSTTPVKAAEELLSRINALDGNLHACIKVMPDHALARAEAVGKALKNDATGPLLGIPYAARDLFDVKGEPTLPVRTCLQTTSPGKTAR